MTGRVGIPKKVRFEVFKRDSFTCQYCGTKAPDVVLVIDHIKPVAEGGDNNIMNLVTSCNGCNAGKGVRLLDDNSVVERQRRQIEELEERRQQLEMMLQWRDELARLNDQLHDTIIDHLKATTGMGVNERGMVDVRRLAKAYPLPTILNSVDDAFGKYGVWRDGKMTRESWNKAFNKIPAFCRAKMKYGEGPEIDTLVYIQAIVRNRIGDKYFKCLDKLKEMYDAGFSLDAMKAAAREIDDEADFHAWYHQWIEADREKVK